MKIIIFFIAMASAFGEDGFKVPRYRHSMSDLELRNLIAEIKDRTEKTRQERLNVEEKLNLEKLRLKMFQERAEKRKYQIIAEIARSIDELEHDVKNYRAVRDGVQTNLFARQVTWSAQEAQIKKLEEGLKELEDLLAQQEQVNRELQTNISKTRAQIAELRKSIPQLRTAQRDRAKKVWKKIHPALGLRKVDVNTGRPLPKAVKIEEILNRLYKLLQDPE